MKKIAFFAFGLFLIILLLANIAGPVGAAEMREMPPRTEVPVNLRLVDEENKPLAGEKMVTIELTRGGLKDPAMLTSGLRIKDGVGHFVYITPATPGLAEVRIIDPETEKVLENLVFYVIEPEPPARKDESFLVTQVTGRAEVQPGGRLLRAGEKLVAGVTVTTAADSWLNLELFDGSRIIVQPGTVMRLVSVKRGIAATGKEVLLTLVSGQLFVASQVFTERDSLFQIITPSAELYASGRAFEVVVFGKGTETIAYQDELLMEDRASGLLFPVAQGQKALLQAGDRVPRYSSHQLTAEMREDILRGEGFSVKKEPAAPGTVPSGFRLGGSMRVVEGIPYTTFILNPQFHDISGSGLSIGLELPFDFNPSTGGFALHGSNPDLTIGPLLDWIKFENETIFLNYDYVEEGLTYGYGLLFGDYVSKTNIGEYFDLFGAYIGLSEIYTGLSRRRTHIGINVAEGFRIEVLAPWNIAAFSPWDFDSDSLYAIRLEETYKLSNSHLQLGLSYVFDSNFRENLGPFGAGIAEMGVALDAGFFVSKTFQPYVEIAGLKTSSFGYGFECGVQGETGAFRYRVAGRYLGEGFHPNYFIGDYEINKLNTYAAFFGSSDFYGRPLAMLDDPVYKEGFGYYVSAGVTVEKILSFDVSFADNSRADTYFPMLTGKLELTLPPVRSLPAVSAGLDFQCFQFTGFRGIPDANTVTSNYVEVMLAKGVYATYKNTYIPGADEYMRELILEVRWGK